LNSQQDYQIFPSFRDHGSSSNTQLVAWVPRTQDLAFHHTITQDSGARVNNTECEGSGIKVFFNAPADPQTYTLQIVYIWELAGSLLQSVGTPSIMQPADKNVIEPVLSMLTNTKATASSAVALATNVAATVSPFLTEGSKLLKTVAGSGLGKEVFDIVTSLFD